MIIDEENDSDVKKAFGARLSSIIGDRKNIDAISKASGVSERMIFRYLSGDALPSIIVAARIARACGVNVDDLLNDNNDKSNELLFKTQPDNDHILIPIAPSAVSAGLGLCINTDNVECLVFSRSMLKRSGMQPEAVEFVPVRGHSMEPTIHDGDVVFMDRSKTEILGDAIYIVSLGDEYRIKRVHKALDGTITLISDNPSYPREVVSRLDAEQIQVVGRVFRTERVL